MLSTPVRAPGTIQLDERRVSIVAFRFEGFIEHVEDVTTGQHVHKGEPLMRVYSPAMASAAAEYGSVLRSKAGSGITPQALKGARRRLEMQTAKCSRLLVEGNIALGDRRVQAARLEFMHTKAAREEAALIPQRLGLHDVKPGKWRLKEFQSSTFN